MDTNRGTAARLLPLVAVVVVALAAGVAMGALPPAEDTPDADAVLEDVEQRYANADTVVGNATVTVANETAEYTRTVSFAAAEPNRTRVAVSADGSEYVAGTNGTVAWVYDGANNTTRIYDGNRTNWSKLTSAGNVRAAGANVSGAMTGDSGHGTANYSYADVRAAIDGNTTARTLRTETIDDDETYVLMVEPTDDVEVSGNLTLWVDAGDASIHRVRATDGTNRTTVAVTDLQFNVSVHESTFRPPDAADVTAVSRERYDAFGTAQDATDLDLQRLAADDYAFAEAVVVTRAGRTVALQRYRGGTNVTVTSTADSLPAGVFDRGDATRSNITVAGEAATYVDASDSAAVVWTNDGVTRAVVADLDRETLVDLAEELRSRDG
jgi:outer membrane lipoprotein-sorting protein